MKQFPLDLSYLIVEKPKQLFNNYVVERLVKHFFYKPPTLIKQHNTYISVTPNYYDSNLFNKPPYSPTKRVGESKNKITFHKRNSRIIQLGHGANWKTFLTLTLASDYYWDNYDDIQKQFRAFIKSLYYRVGKIKYLAVLEHGEKTSRVHYHMLTDIDFDNKIFDYSKNYQKSGKTDRKICNLWQYGWSDVVQVHNENCNAVFYMCKYLRKTKGVRTPIGKREVFSSKGLCRVRVIKTYRPLDYMSGYKFYKKVNNSYVYVIDNDL